MIVHKLPLSGLLLIEQEPFIDDRGMFSRLYCRETLTAHGIAKPIAQVNQSITRKAGSLRGLHFQHPPACETKIVTCVSGAIFDVAVDLRRGSPTFFQWHAEILSAGNMRMLVVPEGFAHGFQTLKQDARIFYLSTAPYAKKLEGRVRFDDPAVGINWPLPVEDISELDKTAADLPASFTGICP